MSCANCTDMGWPQQESFLPGCLASIFSNNTVAIFSIAQGDFANSLRLQPVMCPGVKLLRGEGSHGGMALLN